MSGRFRNLRIAFSTLGGVAGMLLIALWVRSYSWRDAVIAPVTSTTAIGWQSIQGHMAFSVITDPNFVVSTMRGPWDRHTMSVQQWERLSKGLQRSSRRAFPSLIFRKFAVTNNTVAIPYWFLAFLAVAFTAAPWFAWSRRFSLRLLFVAMTLVAGILGLIFYGGR
jgi:hypothetical protein